MENLLISPVTGLEVILGKITPYVIIGIFQSMIILIFAVFLFNIPMLGNIFLLIFVLVLYIFLCLSIGISISSLAQNQLQALQMSSFYFIPSVMLSGFISPFISMPTQARIIGSCLPLTYFIRLIKGLILKGYTLNDLLPVIFPLMGLTLEVILIGLKTFRQTLINKSPCRCQRTIAVGAFTDKLRWALITVTAQHMIHSTSSPDQFPHRITLFLALKIIIRNSSSVDLKQ